MNPCLCCGSDVGDENPPNARHCRNCPPTRCDDCGGICEEWEFHGVIHTWRYGWGWTVPYPGCVVAGEGVDPPDELYRRTEDGGWSLPPGRWLVDDDWDEEVCHLTLVGPAPEVNQ